jgi:hypothetical protein
VVSVPNVLLFLSLPAMSCFVFRQPVPDSSDASDYVRTADELFRTGELTYLRRGASHLAAPW